MKTHIIKLNFFKLLCLLILFTFFIQNTLQAQISVNDFVTTWKTDNPSTLNDTSIKIPTSSSIYNYDVDWDNDGVFDDTGITGEIIHDYGTPGTYTVRIRGQFPHIIINDDSDIKEKILSIEQWGNINWQSMLASFKGANNLIINATDTPNLSSVTSMFATFEGATSLNQNINDWDVSNVEKMQRLFRDATSFNQSLNNWNVSSVDNMQDMFYGALAFNQNINNWNVSNVTNMKNMFFDAETFDQPLNSWNVGNVTNMQKMFAFSPPPPFGGPSLNTFNQPIEQWDVSSVTHMRGMFQFSQSFNQPLNDWDVSNVTIMFGMFISTDSFNQPLDNWDVGNVTDMGSMFLLTEVFDQPLNSWNVTNVTLMDFMFDFAESFDQPLNNWNVSNVTTMERMFTAVTLSTENYDTTLNSWANLTLQNGVQFHGGNSNYCNSETARNTLINDFGWMIIDGGLDCSGLSVSDFNENKISVYPNPVNDVITINANGFDIKEVIIFNINGELINKSNLIQNSLNLKNLSSGLYILKFISDKGFAYKKIIKQ